MDRLVRQHPHLPANQQEMIQAIQRVWLRITRDMIRRLTSLVRRRVVACTEARDGHTRY